MGIVTVIIPAYNKWELTSECLRSLAANSPAEALRVIVADNASTDGTAANCPALGRELFGEKFSFLRFEENRNFGPACNAAAGKADTEYLFFLNNDTLATPGWLPPLLDGMRTLPGLAGAGPLLLYPDNTVQHLGIAIEPTGIHISHLYCRLWAEHPLARKRRRFPAITGAALLLSAARFREAGGFFEEYANGCEDVDLALQLTKDGDFMTVIPESVIFHREGQSEGRHVHEDRNSLLLGRRWNLRKYANLAGLVRDDGYDLRIDSGLCVQVALPPEKRHALLAGLRSRRPFDPAFAVSLLRDEPFWEEGYALICGMLRQAGDIRKVLELCVQRLFFLPGLEAREAMLDAVSDPAMRDLLDSLELVRRDQERAINFILNEEAYRARMEHYCSIFREQGEEGLIASCLGAGKEAADLRARWRGMPPGQAFGAFSK